MSTTLSRPRPTAGDVTRRRLSEFAVVCLLLTWVPWVILGLLGADLEEGPGALVFGLAAAGPSLAALVMWLWRRERRPGPGVRWSFGWPVVAVVLGAAAPLISAIAVNLDDLSQISRHADSTLAEAGLVAAVAFTFLAGPVAEEFGWRGYLQPRLRQWYSRIATATTLGLAWGLWHLPLFFIAGTGQHDDTGLLTGEGLVFFLELVPLSYLMLFVTEHLRGGVPAAILVHAAWNLTDELVPPSGAGGQWLELLVLTAVATLVALRWRHPPATAGSVRPPV
jgi:membrane protease YdiL (CAAX protease family)